MSTGKAAEWLGVTVKTLQRWEREGRLIPITRTDSNRRLYTEAQLREFIGIRRSGGEPTRRIAYCRVSSAAQKPHLEEMVQDMMTIVHCFSGRLYGLRNYRKKLKEAMDADRTPD